MIYMPAFISPVVSISLLIPAIVLPIAVIILVVWFVKKVNSIETSVREIKKLLETQKHNQ